MELLGYQEIPLPLDENHTSKLLFWPQWLGLSEADRLLQRAIETLPWQSDTLKIAGKVIPVPRLHCWFGADRDQYRWSGLSLTAKPFPDWLAQLQKQVEEACGTPFNRCLANYYRDGNDSVDWHSDDEAVLGEAPVIASLSLGAERVFNLRHRQTKQRFDLALPHGSLLMMGAGMQRFWQHRIAKVKGLQAPRINFTFRRVMSASPVTEAV